jgi:hypothetical protein
MHKKIIFVFLIALAGCATNATNQETTPSQDAVASQDAAPRHEPARSQEGASSQGDRGLERHAALQEIMRTDITIVGSCNSVVNVANSRNTKIDNTVCSNNNGQAASDPEICYQEAEKASEYVKLAPTGLVGFVLSPFILGYDFAAQKNADDVGQQAYASCMERHGHIMNGYGVQTFQNGNRYEGEWKDGSFNGHGIFYWKDGGKYDGEWKDGLKSGIGYDVYGDGPTYEGEFEHGMRNGHGVMTWPDGHRYDGEWLNGEQNGPGVLISSRGERTEGVWKRGKLVQ